MSDSKGGEADEESIKPVSSLRSKFEVLSTPSTSTAPPIVKKPGGLSVPAPSAESTRSSLDLPRPQPWELANAGQKEPLTPIKSYGAVQRRLRPTSPPKQRPVSMGPWSPPDLPPKSTAQNPFSPPSTTTESFSGSPRVNIFSPPGISSPGMPRSPPIRVKPQPPLPLQKERPVEPPAPNGRKMSTPSLSSTSLKKPPPPINRSNKPGTPTVTIQTSLGPGNAPQANEATSPFNTPPSSGDSTSKLPKNGTEKAGESYFPPPLNHHVIEARRNSSVPATRHIPQPRGRIGSVPDTALEQSLRLLDRPSLPIRPQPDQSTPLTISVTAPAKSNIDGRKKISANPMARRAEVPREVLGADEFLPPPRRVITSNGKEDSHAHLRIGSTGRISPHVMRAVSDPITNNSSRASSAQGNHSDIESYPVEETQIAGSTSDYPDASRANRRPPKAKGCHLIYPDYDTRQFDICGRYCCTIGFITKFFDTTTGRMLHEQSFYERDMKATAVVFKPGATTEQEGQTVWIGNNVGEIQEFDIPHQRVVHTRSNAHNRREIIKMYRFQNSIWSVDEDGKFHVWPADDKGVPSLQNQPIVHRVARGHTFSIVVKRHLWFACGKDIRVYDPMGGEDYFHVTTHSLSQPNAGDVTSGAVTSRQLDRVYFGHSDGKISVYTSNFDCLGVVNASSYKINSMVGAGDYLWAGFNTGKICVYDTSTTPWTVKKDWMAHSNPLSSLVVDKSAVWKSGFLAVASMGLDKTICLWDGWLEADWLEVDMQDHDVEFCDFREIKAMVCTWNAGASTPGTLRAEDRDSGFFREIIRTQDPPDIIMFGFQELVDLEDKKLTAKTLFKGTKKKDATDHEHMSRQYRAWRDYLARVIEDYMPASEPYTLLQTANLVGLFSCIFVKSSQRTRITDVQVTEVKRGLGGLHGNKGALILRFVLDNSSLCFTNCHLAAGQNHTAHRNDDITAILEASNLPKEPSLDRRLDTFVGGGDGSQIMDHEICIINGDMNYRIDTMGRETVIKAINAGNLNRLLDRDQLLVSKRRNPAFRLRSFREQPITFTPTYKYDVGTDRYDTSEKARSPAWCDRILYRGQGKIKQLQYRRHDGIRISDHRPVSGVFAMRVKQIKLTQRAKAWERCEERLVAVKKRYARDAKLDYLITVLGVDPREATRLIVH